MTGVIHLKTPPLFVLFITHTGYIYANGLSETYVGVATAMSSVAGIIGAVLYTQLHRCLGLERTGLISFTFQLSCLSMCLLSIWLPGSPFQPHAIAEQFSREPQLSVETADSTTETMVLYDVSVNATTEAYESEERHSAVTPSIIVFVCGIVVSRIGEVNRIMRMIT